MHDRLARQLRLEEEDARTNPLYAVEVKRIPARRARAAGVPIDPNLPEDASIGILNHEVAYDPKYPPEGQERAQDGASQDPTPRAP